MSHGLAAWALRFSRCLRGSFDLWRQSLLSNQDGTLALIFGRKRLLLFLLSLYFHCKTPSLHQNRRARCAGADGLLCSETCPYALHRSENTSAHSSTPTHRGGSGGRHLGAPYSPRGGDADETRQREGARRQAQPGEAVSPGDRRSVLHRSRPRAGRLRAAAARRRPRPGHGDGDRAEGGAGCAAIIADRVWAGVSSLW